MKMNTQFTVSVQLMLLIMKSTEQKMTSELISESTGANPVMIRQLFGKLKKANLLKVAPGRGATELSRDPSDISLWDIYMAVEEYHPNDFFQFHPKISGNCQIGKFIKEILTPHLDVAIQAMGKEMSQVSLAQLMDEWYEANPK